MARRPSAVVATDGQRPVLARRSERDSLDQRLFERAAGGHQLIGVEKRDAI